VTAQAADQIDRLREKVDPGIPAFGLGQLAGRCDDQPSAGGPLTLTAILDGDTAR
jgi:hypothetical protein